MNSNDETLEIHDFWEETPLWCQPWSIILTGIIIFIITYFLFDIIILQIFISICILAWWYIFLFIAPKAYNINKQ